MAFSSSKFDAVTVGGDPWKIREEGFDSDKRGVSESLFAQANGYIGLRGTFDEPSNVGAQIEGTFLNGVYVREAIHYDENAYGFASHNNKLVCVPDAKDMLLHLDGADAPQKTEALAAHMRELDMQTGMLTRKGHWMLNNGTLAFTSRRFVSLSQANIVAFEFELGAAEFEGKLSLSTGLNTDYGGSKRGDDPRAGAVSIEDCLESPAVRNLDAGCVMNQAVVGTDVAVVSAFAAEASLNGQPVVGERVQVDGLWCQRFTFDLKHGDKVKLVKFVYYGDTNWPDAAELETSAADTLADALENGFEALLQQQRQVFSAFWQTADICIEGSSEAQQGIRFNLFHLFQSSGRDGQRSLAAKGLTGPGYDGHYFWDTEIYAVPFFVFTCPEVARALLRYRVTTLEAARERARTMGHKSGALFPWRTIGGEECSSYFPAGTAQYHINAAIAYALVQYVEVTGDTSLLHQGGAELLFETARIWLQLGHHSERRGGKFSIHEVTGPDEYSAMVDNNLYTNMMAQHHLQAAADTAKSLADESAAFYQELAATIRLEPEEVMAWSRAAADMYIPFDNELCLHEQHDGFFAKPEWNFEGTPADKYPLLLNYHPLVIYRHQVLKQADVVLAQILLSDKFSLSEKAKNLAYYEPRTTHDSTLSACVYSIANAESGDKGRAYSFFEETFRMDLENRHKNTHYGVHIACMAGSWMSVVYGFAGMRYQAGHLHFAPYLPDGWDSYRFKVKHRSSVVDVTVKKTSVTYSLVEGGSYSLWHRGELVHLEKSEPVSLAA